MNFKTTIIGGSSCKSSVTIAAANALFEREARFQLDV